MTTPDRPAKNRGGRPKRVRDVDAVAKLIRLFHEGITKGVPAHGPTGEVLLDAAGQPVRRQPSAAWLGVATKVLAELGAFKRAAADPRIVAKFKPETGEILARLRATNGGKLPPLSEDDDAATRGGW